MHALALAWAQVVHTWVAPDTHRACREFGSQVSQQSGEMTGWKCERSAPFACMHAKHIQQIPDTAFGFTLCCISYSHTPLMQ